MKWITGERAGKKECGKMFLLQFIRFQTHPLALCAALLSVHLSFGAYYVNVVNWMPFPIPPVHFVGSLSDDAFLFVPLDRVLGQPHTPDVFFIAYSFPIILLACMCMQAHAVCMQSISVVGKYC